MTPEEIDYWTAIANKPDSWVVDTSTYILRERGRAVRDGKKLDAMQEGLRTFSENTCALVIDGTFAVTKLGRTWVEFAYTPLLGNSSPLAFNLPDRASAGRFTFFEPTTKIFSLPPGSSYFWTGGGPPDAPWSVTATTGVPPEFTASNPP
jgi:hypothetical protein